MTVPFVSSFEESTQKQYAWEATNIRLMFEQAMAYRSMVGTMNKLMEIEENRADGRENRFGGTTGMFEGEFSTP